jgi:phosphoribosyl 1,2-cyclic phosphodiesterase
VRLTVCGTRGSTPSPGPEFAKYGGHTSCVALAHDDRPPTLLLDAGTGIRRVTHLLGGHPFDGSILLGHLHWDHTQGLPFFAAGDRSDSNVAVYAPAQGDTEEVLAGFMSPPHFPITPGELRGNWSFHALEPGQHRIEGFDVLALEIPHKGGRTFGFRVSDGRATVAYLSDHCPTAFGPGPDGLGDRHEAAIALVEGCDVLLHDSQYTDEELSAKAAFGHSSAGYAAALAAEAGVGHLLLFHHDPSRTDEAVSAIAAGYADSKIPVCGAREGMVLELPD